MINDEYSVSLSSVAREQGLAVLHAAKDFGSARVRTADVNRPALQLAGFYDYFDPKRLQLIGRVESTYLMSLPEGERREALERFMRFDLCAIILCHGIDEIPELMEFAVKYDRTIMSTSEDTSTFMADLISMLRNAMAPRVTLHGVLVEVYGEGLLITGDSGVGKSETALELIKRGHRLIADDAVEIRRISRETLIGKAPALIRYYMELRGIGVINARHIFGVGAVKPETGVDLVVNFELWDDEKTYDRLGLETEHTSILGVDLPSYTVPVRPGRNLAVILELAAMNNRQKKMGYNAAEALAREHDALVDSGKDF
ncbi:MAG TPA: HPr(Ser) kinase/phosphatase [Candidatus Scatomorpha merdipullorum]|uniref:HPr kinase/phosphorylase n=1 Tax=Candidatus Scatomorpha merdipullorum TaxID=2840927 RepID=A0A9D1FDV1_9FIRM|nr:HPr(Ser) kinase/phosphatase [Candidatus Scatomorpha merdipullorum]